MQSIQEKLYWKLWLCEANQRPTSIWNMFKVYSCMISCAAYCYLYFISHFRWCRHFGKPYSARTPTDDLMTKLSTSLFVSHIKKNQIEQIDKILRLWFMFLIRCTSHEFSCGNDDYTHVQLFPEGPAHDFPQSLIGCYLRAKCYERDLDTNQCENPLSSIYLLLGMVDKNCTCFIFHTCEFKLYF